MIARVELECAMAAVITSPTAKEHFEADAAAFGATFGLPADEIVRLRRMGPDLGALTDGFVSKRATTTRWNARRTLALIGPAANVLVREFIDLHPATESFRDEARSFGEFVIERTASRRDGSARADVIAEMARFERCRSACFWGAVAEFEPRPDLPRAKRLRVRPGATTAAFDFDLRMLHHDTTMAAELCRPDPCTLCFVHLGAAGFRVVRLQEAEVRLVESFGGSDEPDFDDAGGRPADTDGPVNGLVRRGVLEWA